MDQKTAWLRALESLDKDYHKNFKILFGSQKISIQITRVSSDDENRYTDIEYKYLVKFLEEYEDDIEYFLDRKFEQVLLWAEDTLINWKNCYRHDYSSWIFDSKEDAEKLSILYYLKWQK